jgi:hypothetical protein
VSARSAAKADAEADITIFFDPAISDPVAEIANT